MRRSTDYIETLEQQLTTSGPWRKYLGLNADEEDVWIDDSDEALEAMLDRNLPVLVRTQRVKKGVWDNEDGNPGKNGDHSQQERRSARCPSSGSQGKRPQTFLRKAYDGGITLFRHGQGLFRQRGEDWLCA